MNKLVKIHLALFYSILINQNISEINELKECTVQLEDIGTNSLLWDITKMRENEYRIENNDTCNEIKQGKL